MSFKSILLTALVFTLSANVSAATVFIDDFTIVKNGNVIFNDAFNNGSAPADNGGNTQQYNVLGGPLGTESGGKLALNANLGQAVERPDAGAMQRQGAKSKNKYRSFATN